MVGGGGGASVRKKAKKHRHSERKTTSLRAVLVVEIRFQVLHYFKILHQYIKNLLAWQSPKIRSVHLELRQLMNCAFVLRRLY